MKMVNKRIVQFIVLSLTTLIFIGCQGAIGVKRGLLNNSTYYSTSNPNIKIVVNDEFQYPSEQERNEHKFVNTEKHKWVYIRYYPPHPNPNIVDYYNNPDSWIFNNYNGSIELDRGKMEMLSDTWYYRDCFWQASSSTCAIIRDLGNFTSNHSTFKIIYIVEQPPHNCSEWHNDKSLSKKQQDVYNQFLEDLANDLKITNYAEK